MRTSVIILLALCSCSFASPQEVFIYSQNGEKHYFQTVDSLIQVQFKDGTNKDKMLSVARSIEPLIGDIDISNSNKVIIHYNNKLLDFERISNDSSLVYANKSLLYSDGAIQIPTNKVMVKIKIGYSLPDLLTQMKIDYKSFRRIGHNGNAYIIYLNNGESIKVANYLYESNYFESSQPSFARFMETSNTHFDDQWGLINTGQNDGTEGIDINVYDAWDITEGNENISIAVLDDGVDLDHPDLEDNLRTGYDATEDGGNLVGDCFNVDAHGTACAGIISAIDNTIGIKGVAPYCEIIPIRMHYTNTYSQLYSEEEWIIDAINHAWDDAEADILSCSWEINGSRIDLVEDEIDFALENGRDNQGCVVVFASGNDNSSSIDYPADYNSDIIAVGAMSPCGERKSATSCDDEDWPNNGGSNYGDELDLIAPGVFIPTTDIQGSFGYNTTVGSSGDYHLDFWGTSAATPHVAGVAALVLSANPNLSQDQVRDILESTAQKVGSYSYSTTNGRTNGTWSNRVGYMD